MELGTGFWTQIGRVVGGFDSEGLKRVAAQPFSVALIARNETELVAMERFFVPRGLSAQKHAESRRYLELYLLPLAPDDPAFDSCSDIVVSAPSAYSAALRTGLVPHLFDYDDPERTARDVIREHPDLALPLAKHFIHLRPIVQHQWIRSCAWENAAFAAAAAAKHSIPAGRFLLSWLTGTTSATVFLTANQMRMAFLIAAANDAEVGFRQQSGQLTAITSAAFGSRALARRWGLHHSRPSSIAAEALIAFSTTYMVGLALEQFHAIGRYMSYEEKIAAYEKAYSTGKKLLDGILTLAGARSRSTA